MTLLQHVQGMPGRALDKARRLLRARRLGARCQADPSSVFLASATLVNHQDASAIHIGAHCIVGGELLVFPGTGRIRVGDFCFIGPGTRIWSADDISIGNRVLISHGVNVHDCISHSLSAAERHRQFAAMALRSEAGVDNVPRKAIVIEDDAWIGLNAIVLKGVRIGRGAVVAAGAIVTRDVPPFAVVAGSTAAQIGHSYE